MHVSFVQIQINFEQGMFHKTNNSQLQNQCIICKIPQRTILNSELELWIYHRFPQIKMAWQFWSNWRNISFEPKHILRFFTFPTRGHIGQTARKSMKNICPENVAQQMSNYKRFMLLVWQMDVHCKNKRWQAKHARLKSHFNTLDLFKHAQICQKSSQWMRHYQQSVCYLSSNSWKSIWARLLSQNQNSEELDKPGRSSPRSNLSHQNFTEVKREREREREREQPH